jgi:hypothetical protein
MVLAILLPPDSMETIDKVIIGGISLTVNIVKATIIRETEGMANIGNIMIVIN